MPRRPSDDLPERGPLPPPANPLDRKRMPTQARALETIERILEAAALTLREVGVERLSTNLVCERAGLSPPALYRWFPNKYALLAELGLRLMLAQNEPLQRWATPATMRLPRAAFEAGLLQLFLDTLAITRGTTAGEWITRSLRAVPALAPVRTGSHDLVSDLLTQAFLQAWPGADPVRTRLVARLSVEVMYSAHELLFEDPSLNDVEVGRTLSQMVFSQVESLRQALPLAA